MWCPWENSIEYIMLDFSLNDLIANIVWKKTEFLIFSYNIKIVWEKKEYQLHTLVEVHCRTRYYFQTMKRRIELVKLKAGTPNHS